MNKTCKIILSVIISIFIIFAIVLVTGVKNYIDESPVITAKDDLSVKVGTTISIEELADIKNAAESKILSDIMQTDGKTNAKVSDDGQSLFVGDDETNFQVEIRAIGANHEERREQVTVHVNGGVQ